MRIAFSNLAWEPGADDDVLTFLASAGLTGLEIAPAKVFDDVGKTTEAQAAEYRKTVQDKGLSIVAFQAYLFGRPELRLFDDSTRQGFIDFTKRTIDLMVWCGGDRIVYGAPKSRDRLGREFGECREIALRAFSELGAYAANRDVAFCLEPNPPIYGCNFASCASEAAKLVRQVDSPGFRLHLDTACMTLAGDDVARSIRDNADILAHFHASEPQLGDFSAPEMDHTAAAGALRESGYAGWVSIEMKPTENIMTGIRQATGYVLDTYGD
ncbi:MAG: sugar phosphate isomerase/epimerase family protein [Patescibacteria group bacterium]|nr:sugar phosphate isomerase/epimerase family protein [Patescibacteria group bacterium]